MTLALDLAEVTAPRWRARPTLVRLEPAGGPAVDVTLVPGEPVGWGPAGRGRPTVRLSGSAEVLAAITTGGRSGVSAFLDGQLGVRGDLSLALALDAVFHPGPVGEDQVRRLDLEHVGGRTAALASGPATAAPVVLVHGLGATAASMLPVQRALHADHRVLSLDTVGHGDSDKPRGRYDAPMLADWLLACLDAAGLDRVALVGNSLGGRIALEVAMSHPERVAGLVLLCPSPAFVRLRQAVPAVRLLRPELAVAPLPAPPHAAVVAGIRSMLSRPSRLPPAWYDAGADEFLRVWRQPAGRRAFLTALRAIYLEQGRGERGFWQRLSALAPPALWVWGERDRLVPAGFAGHVRRQLPAARQEVLADSGHVPQFEHPDLTAALVRDHLASLSW